MESQKFRERVDTRVATALDRRLVDRMAGSRAYWSPAGFVSIAMATLVHLVVVALTVGGLGLIVLGDNVPQRIAGGVVLLPVLLLVRGRERRDDVRVEPAAAPAFTALVEEVARALGTRPPTYIGIDDDINASAARTGLRSRVLVIGAPLWVALGPQARLALLGHELGHFAHRDVVHGRYVGAAIGTLTAWVRASTPEATVTSHGRTPLLATLGLWPIRAASTGYLYVLWWVNAAASRRAELRADTDSARVAGTPAALESLELTLLVDVVDRAINRAAVDPSCTDVATEIRDRVTNLSRRAREAARAEAGESRVDQSHPPTVERLRLQASRPPASAQVVLDTGRRRAIDAELQPMLDAALRRRADWYR